MNSTRDADSLPAAAASNDRWGLDRPDLDGALQATASAGQVREFGRLRDERLVEGIRLSWPGGVDAEILTWGATVRAFGSPTSTGRIEALLQLPNLSDYEADTRYLNTVIGRCANRIGEATFAIDGERFEIEANEGPNALHGGAAGWSKRLWRIVSATDRRCVLAYTSPEGEGGFPGEVEARVVFALIDAQTLEIVWLARPTRPTPVNLTHHLYFNLSGSPSNSILSDTLEVAADAITPVGCGLIPTGEVLPVEGTPFDLRQPRRIGSILEENDPQLALGGGIDLNWVLSGQSPAVRLHSSAGMSLGVETDQPALQVYTGQGLCAPFLRHGALVLEPQGFPDAPNEPTFPSVIATPTHTYRRAARYRLSQIDAQPGSGPKSPGRPG